MAGDKGLLPQEVKSIIFTWDKRIDRIIFDFCSDEDCKQPIKVDGNSVKLYSKFAHTIKIDRMYKPYDLNHDKLKIVNSFNYSGSSLMPNTLKTATNKIAGFEHITKVKLSIEIEKNNYQKVRSIAFIWDKNKQIVEFKLYSVSGVFNDSALIKDTDLYLKFSDKMGQAYKQYQKEHTCATATRQGTVMRSFDYTGKSLTLEDLSDKVIATKMFPNFSDTSLDEVG